jgi:hypothetical protein
MSISSGPFVLWVGLNVDNANTRDATAVERYFTSRFATDVASEHPALGRPRCYDLIAPDRHRGFGSRFLVEFDVVNGRAAAKAAETAADLSVSAAPRAWGARVSTDWVLAYRFLNETDPPTVRPYGIYMVGVDPPADIDEAGLLEFNAFYTDVHVPEVARRRHCLRAARYELAQDELIPPEGRPRFVAVYEVDEKGAARAGHVGFGYTKGPRVWERHKTPWRLWYRLLPD